MQTKTYYHVTQLHNLDNIMINGLVPQVGVLSAQANETIPRVYLFPSLEDMEIALSSWLGETYEQMLGDIQEKVENDETIDNFDGFDRNEILEMDELPLCSLKITIPDDFKIEDGEVEYECYSNQIIPSKYIEFFREE